MQEAVAVAARAARQEGRADHRLAEMAATASTPRQAARLLQEAAGAGAVSPRPQELRPAGPGAAGSSCCGSSLLQVRIGSGLTATRESSGGDTIVTITAGTDTVSFS